MDFRDYYIGREETGIFNILFPNHTLYIDQFPAFPIGERFILISDKKDLYVGNREVIRFSLNKGTKKLMDKAVFIEFLLKLEIKISENMKNKLMFLVDDQFWIEIKNYLIFKESRLEYSKSEESVFNLFEGLFENFKESYRIYRELALSHKVIFSSLITMMSKTMFTESITVSPYYKKVLIKNKGYMNKFKRSVIMYLSTPQREVDFLSLLYDLSRG